MLQLFNSLTKQKEIFQPIKDKEVRMYSCGPTVYDFIHLGNLRSFLIADFLRRFLEWEGFKVIHVMNITDVGHMVADQEVGQDKVEEAAKRQRKTPWQIAAFYKKAFFADIKKMNFKKAYRYPEASKHIKEMIDLIEKLLKNGHAYIVNGSVYFDVNTFPNYGALSGNRIENLKAGARIEINPEKRNPYDFALWIENPKHLMRWRAPWSKEAGYPGWHIECSAMSMKYLGEHFDIHTGGEDNKFPHHECEIAQSEGATKKKFVNYWLHIKHLLVNGEKMSKSLKNFYTLRDILKLGYSPESLRLLLLSAHYRENLNFTFDSLKSAARQLQSWKNLVALIRFYQKVCKKYSLLKRENNTLFRDLIKQTREKVKEALEDDLNTPLALAVLADFQRQVNSLLQKGEFHESFLKELFSFLKELDNLFGLNLTKKPKEKIPFRVKKYLKEREKARLNKNWALADSLRRKIEKAGFVVEDTRFGPFLKVKSEF